MKKHPVSTYLFVGTFDFFALLLVCNELIHFSTYSKDIRVAFIVWTIILCIGQLVGFIEFINSKVLIGWATSTEFAAVLILPFPLLCISILISSIINLINLIYQKHPEPFLRLCFNIQKIILSAFLSKKVYNYTLLYKTVFESNFALVFSALIFFVVQMLIITAYYSIDSHKPCILSLNFYTSEIMLILSGAVIAYLYKTNTSILVLMVIPLFLLNNRLYKLNDTRSLYIDKKTGIHNFRYFDEKLSQLFTISYKQNIPLAIIFSDMDDLRNVNNTYGHPAGDKALMTVGKILKEISTQDLIVARFGGEEFVILLPNYNKIQAYYVAEKIRRKVQETPIILDTGNQINVTMSLGVSSFPEESQNIKELIKTADDALYEAKHNGKNSIVIYHSQDFKETV